MKLWRFLKRILVYLAIIFIIQFVYFASIYSCKSTSEKSDLVMVYGSPISSYMRGLELARQFHCPLYFSEDTPTIRNLIDSIAEKNVLITFDPSARTTDQNARNSAAFIQKGRYKRVALVCYWDHAPRALFLAHLYLLGSGVQIDLYPDEPVPNRYWMTRDFWIQMFRFWGSLARVGLHVVGIDDWPAHS